MPEASPAAGRAPFASVVIPAHDEGATIGRCLNALAEAMVQVPLEIVVAANGCRDDTAAVARGFAGVHVVEVSEASKIAALNAADQVVRVFPRIYLDADVVLEPDAVQQLVAALSIDDALLAVPGVAYETEGSDAVVRAFYSVQQALRAGPGLPVGRGVYALSGAGRARFGDFPAVQGDDLFVSRLFEPHETTVVPGRSTIRAPRGWRDLLRVRTRVVSGNAELARQDAATARVGDHGDFARSGCSTLTALGRLVLRDPRTAPAVATFLSVSATARWRARGARATTWHRDTSTR